MKFATYLNTTNNVFSITGKNTEKEEVGTGHMNLGKCHIMFLNISPGLQRQGYGTEILEEMERRALARGCDYLTVSTTSESDPFWQKKGYHHAWYDPIRLGKRFKNLG